MTSVPPRFWAAASSTDRARASRAAKHTVNDRQVVMDSLLSALADETQAVQFQIWAHVVDRAGDVGDERGQPAGGDHCGRSTHLRPHTLHEAIDEPRVAV